MKSNRKSYDPNDDDDSWSKPTILSRFSSLGIKGRLYYFGGALVAANLVALIFGFYFPRMLIAGGCAVFVGLILPKSIDE
jgi:hypothetical protein